MINSKDAGKALVASATPNSPKSQRKLSSSETVNISTYVLSPPFTDTQKIEKLVKYLYDADQEKATDAAKQLAELAQTSA